MPDPRFTYANVQSALRRLIRNEHLVLVVLALIVGSIAGGAVIGFREAIEFVQSLAFGISTDRLAQHAVTLPAWQILLAPTVGGLIVGILIHKLMPGGRPQGVADVIEASAMRGGQMSSRIGLVAAISSAISIGTGASVGREGPAVHLGASLAGWIGRRLHLSRSLTRTILGCGVAAAVSASFNAPIAGALFASEVVVGQYALKTLAPVVMASVAGTALSQLHFGDASVFFLGDSRIASFLEFPAFMGLGVVSALAAIVMMRAIFLAQGIAADIPAPAWLKPAIGGLCVGILALGLPEVLGVGYGVVEWSVLGQFSLNILIAIAAAKILATAVALGFGFAGGVFSPALVIGAVTGAAYGIIAASIFPELASGVGVYTLVGMGATAAAVLGAPISTTLIVFEITGDYKLSLAVMLAVVVATELTHHFFGQSFFAMQLNRREIDLKDGFERELLRAISVGDIVENGGAVERETIGLDLPLSSLRERLSRSSWGELFVVRDDGRLFGTITLGDCGETLFDVNCDSLITALDVARPQPPFLSETDNLEQAIATLRASGEDHIAVVRDKAGMIFTGCLHHRDVMNAYTQALLAVRHEEHNQQ
ncbi:MAG: chloride channel protein [Proteobacteria bacterium]|nr:chloride channel protein [Pseudomonadota bacterium]